MRPESPESRPEAGFYCANLWSGVSLRLYTTPYAVFRTVKLIVIYLYKFFLLAQSAAECEKDPGQPSAIDNEGGIREEPRVHFG